MRLAHHSMTWYGYWNKNKIAPDVDRLLAETKRAGYDGTELGGHEKTLGQSTELKKKLAAHGLEVGAWALSVTANPYGPNTEDYRRGMDYAAEMGVKVMAVCGGFIPCGRRTTFEADYKLFGENLQAACDYAARNGQEIAFHPHLGCMVETDAELDRVLRLVPQLKVCVDTGHQIAAGTDPALLIRKHGARVAHIHLKDYDPANYCFTELGQGSAGLDFARVFQTVRDLGYAGWISVERDNPTLSGEESAKLSRAFLRNFSL